MIMTQPVQLTQDNSDLSSVISVGSDLNRYLEGLEQTDLVEKKLAAYEVASTTDRTLTILSALASSGWSVKLAKRHS